MKRLLLALAILGSCSDSVPPAGSPGGPEKSKLVSKGEAFSTAGILAPGYVTVVDFYADW